MKTVDYYPNCTFCGNTGLSIFDVDINGVLLKGIRCNACQKFVGFYKDYSEEVNKLSEDIDDLKSRVSDLER